jgi:hypothetical protein
MNDWDEPDTMAIVKRVGDAMRAWRKAQTKVVQCRRPDSKDAAIKACAQAEKAYRKAAEERDQFMEIRRAQRVQRGGK